MTLTIDEARQAMRQHYDTFGREVRTSALPASVRAGDQLYGHAAVFNTVTVIGGWFREQVAPGTFTKTIQEADVRHLFNHDPNIVLGRTKNKTLRLSEDEKGLAYDNDLNMADPDAVSVRAKAERGDIDQSSFAFRVVKDMWEESEKDGGLALRTILEAELFDTSIVTYPAYKSADSGLRAVGYDVLTRSLGLTDEQRTELMFSLVSGKPLTPELEPILVHAREAVDEMIATCRVGAGSHTHSLADIDEEAGGEPLPVEPPEEPVEPLLYDLSVRHAFNLRRMADLMKEK